MAWTTATDGALLALAETDATRTELNLPFSRVTDRGLAHLPHFTRLKKLNLSHTRVSDAVPVGAQVPRPGLCTFRRSRTS